LLLERRGIGSHIIFLSLTTLRGGIPSLSAIPLQTRRPTKPLLSSLLPLLDGLKPLSRGRCPTIELQPLLYHPQDSPTLLNQPRLRLDLSDIPSLPDPTLPLPPPKEVLSNVEAPLSTPR